MSPQSLTIFLDKEIKKLEEQQVKLMNTRSKLREKLDKHEIFSQFMQKVRVKNFTTRTQILRVLIAMTQTNSKKFSINFAYRYVFKKVLSETIRK